MADDPSGLDNPFAAFFQDPLYLEFKNHLYNYRLRRRKVRKELLKLENPQLILEIGSGVSTMTEGGDGIIFSDISWEAVRHLKEKKIARRALVMSVTDIALKSESIPAIVCSEVIEHVKDDQKALQEMYRVLEPGGSLILTVPVHPRYFAYDDHYVKHERRYAVWPFLKKLRRIGFKNLHMVKVTGFLDKITMIALAAAYSVFADPKTDRPPQKAGLFLKMLLPVYKILNWIYSRIVRLEARLMPLSTSAVVLIHCTKAGNPMEVSRQKDFGEEVRPKAV